MLCTKPSDHRYFNVQPAVLPVFKRYRALKMSQHWVLYMHAVKKNSWFMVTGCLGREK